MWRSLLLPLCAPLLFAQSEVYVYLAEGQDEAALRQQLAPTLQEGGAQDIPQNWVTLPQAASSNLTEARQVASALKHGVQQLPCAVLVDKNGAYALIHGRGLTTPQAWRDALQQERSPEHAAQDKENRVKAMLYLLRASMTQASLNDAELEKAILRCHKVLQSSDYPIQARQLVALRYQYPLMMEQYARQHPGAHTPRTERQLLDAIAILEYARDLDKESPLGRQAHAERERLRKARLQARQYE